VYGSVIVVPPTLHTTPVLLIPVTPVIAVITEPAGISSDTVAVVPDVVVPVFVSVNVYVCDAPVSTDAVFTAFVSAKLAAVLTVVAALAQEVLPTGQEEVAVVGLLLEPPAGATVT